MEFDFEIATWFGKAKKVTLYQTSCLPLLTLICFHQRELIHLAFCLQFVCVVIAARLGITCADTTRIRELRIPSRNNSKKSSSFTLVFLLFLVFVFYASTCSKTWSTNQARADWIDNETKQNKNKKKERKKRKAPTGIIDVFARVPGFFLLL